MSGRVCRKNNRSLVRLLTDTSKTVDHRYIVHLDVRFRTRDDAETHLGHDVSFSVGCRRDGHVAYAALARIHASQAVVAIHHDLDVIDNLWLGGRIVLRNNLI